MNINSFIKKVMHKKFWNLILISFKLMLIPSNKLNSDKKNIQYKLERNMAVLLKYFDI